MALIKCPECGKEISNKAKNCPNCGYKLKNKNSKLLLIVVGIIMIITIITLLIIGVVKNRSINNDINKVLSGEISDAKEILSVKRKYDELGSFSKLFITNKKRFASFRIELTSENFKDYFDIKVSTSDFKVLKTGRNILFDEYKGIANLTVVIQPKASYACDNVYLSLESGIYENYKNTTLSNIMLDENGSYTETREIYWETTYTEPTEPLYLEGLVKITEISGSIYFK